MTDRHHDDPSQQRLDELGEHIEHARDNAREILDEPDQDEPLFYESGEQGDELDDQQIAPPG